MERFPLDHVEEPTSVTNSDRLDVYNNIVLFRVREALRRDASSEMHIFQCIGRPVSTHPHARTPHAHTHELVRARDSFATAWEI